MDSRSGVLRVATAPAAALVLLARLARARPRGGGPSPLAATRRAPGERDRIRALRAGTARRRCRRAALERVVSRTLPASRPSEGDGSFPAGTRESWSPVGVNSLSVPRSSPRGTRRRADPTAAGRHRTLLAARSRRSADRGTAGLHPRGRERRREDARHGLATLALAEAYGMSPAHGEGDRHRARGCRRLHRARAVDGGRLVLLSRVDEQPRGLCDDLRRPGAARGKRRGDPRRLRADQSARRLRQARLQQANGAFAYTLGTPDKTSVALTAAGLATLHSTGVYTGREVDDAYDWLWRTLTAREDARAAGNRALDSSYPCYERFYLAQALWQNRDETAFRGWYEKEKKPCCSCSRRTARGPRGARTRRAPSVRPTRRR